MCLKTPQRLFPAPLWTVVTALPVIPHQGPSVLLTPLFLSSSPRPLPRWLRMLPCSGLRRGPLERLRRSSGDRQCSRHHTQPGRSTSRVCHSGVPSSCSVTSSPPLISFLPVLLLCLFSWSICLNHYWLGWVLLWAPETSYMVTSENSVRFQQMLLKVSKRWVMVTLFQACCCPFCFQSAQSYSYSLQ